MHKGCPARGHFVEVLASPYTIVQSKQNIHLKESVKNHLSQSQGLNVELSQNNVDSAVVGAVVTVTGVMKHRRDNSQKFQKKEGGHLLSFYLKSFSVEIYHKFAPLRSLLTNQNLEFINLMKSEPSIFRILANSLCSGIYGREEVKAGLILCLLSGKDLIRNRRSESHILLVGSPGAGKSKLLQACTEVSSKAILVCGPTSTGVGLTVVH